MFVHDRLDLERPYEQLSAVLRDDPSWLDPLVTVAIAEARRITVGASSESDEPVMSPGAVRCELGRISLRSHALTLPMRWTSRLDLSLFPETLDADLDLVATGHARSRLSLDGTYPRPPSSLVDPDLLHRTTELAIHGYVQRVGATLLG